MRSLRGWLAGAFAASFVVVAGGAGCAPAQSRVTDLYWHSHRVLFVAYQQTQGATAGGMVKRCLLGDDNVLTCEDMAEVNKLLQAAPR